MMVKLYKIKKDVLYVINFFNPKSFFYFLLVFLSLLYFFAFIQNISNAFFTFKAIGLGALINYLSFSVIGALFHVSVASSIMFVFTIMFLSIYLVMFISKFKNAPDLSGSGLGIISGIITFFGLGCVSCGGLILASLFATIGITGIVAFLPFRGFEIQLLALIVSVISLLIFVRKSRARVCKV